MTRWVIGALGLVVALGAAGLLFLRSELPKYQAAFLYAYGPYEFVRSVQELSVQANAEEGLITTAAIRNADPEWREGPFLNRHAHNTQLVDHTQRSVTTPNTDTLYTSAVLELSSTPVELTLPDVGSRYLSVALMDVFTDQFAHLGPRETGGRGGVYWIVGPDDTTEPPDGVTLIRATGDDVWLLARTFVSGRDDLDAARAAQAGVSVRPVFPDRPPRPFTHLATDIADAENFLAVTNEALARNSTHPQSARAAEFAALGIGPDATPGPIERLFWSLVTPRAEAAITRQISEGLSVQTGWSDPPRDIGDYGEDDALRAGIALIGFGALRREDAIYYRMTRTEDGEPLDGSRTYRMILPPDVPAQAFWSIAVYAPDDTGRFFFFDNPTGRHSLNSGADTLNYSDDGSLLLQFGPDAPTDAGVNWMPTPNGPFAAFFRIYLPNVDAVEQGWTPPVLAVE